MRVITPAAWVAQPWRNGRGVTHEIVRWPALPAVAPAVPAVSVVPGLDAPYDLRISLAAVTADGPFSTFPGQRRWSVLAGAEGVELAPDPARAGRTDVPPFAAVRLAAPGSLVELDGAVPLIARLLGGPTHLLNVLATVPVACGAGPTTRAVLAVIALVDTPTLPRWHARVFDEPAVTDTTGCAWITWAARRP